MVVLIVLACLAILSADVGAQFLPGSAHEASPVLDSGLLGILGMVVAASRGPRPDSEPPPAGAPLGVEPPPPPPAVHDPAAGVVPPGDGRHRAPGEQP